MQITTDKMRAAVSGWLAEEGANKQQTLQLLDAVYAGAIDGGTYRGNRPFDEIQDLIDRIEEPARIGPMDEGYSEGKPCGCLVDTLERIKHGRPSRTLAGASAEAFALALKIPLGATPDNNVWSRAAAEGIEDHYRALE